LTSSWIPDDPIIGLDAGETARRIRDGELSAIEVTESHINRIEEVNPRLNAVVIPLFAEARDQAAAADLALQRGEDIGPLHGVPVTIKEQYRVAGTQTTLGASKKIGNVYHDEGPLVTRLRDAGAIILGKTNIIQTLAGWESDNPVYGRTNNPWDLDRTPGGSSGGEAAIVAAGGSVFGLAGDFGGSIRLPAHFSGVHGYKPTSHRLSNDDFASGLLEDGQEAFIPQPGPIARSMGDIKLAMRLFAETSLSTTSDLVPPVPWPEPDAVNASKLRVGIYTDNGYFPASPSVRRAVRDAGVALEGLGIPVVPVDAPDPEEAVRLFLGAASASGAVGFFRLLDGEKPMPQIAGLLRGAKLPGPMKPLIIKLMEARGQDHVARILKNVNRRSAEGFMEIVAATAAYKMAFTRILDEAGVDAIICPPVALPAFTHGSSEHLFPAVTYALTYNILGAPAGVVSITKVRPGEESERESSRDLADVTAARVEQGSAGLPLGVQVVARHWRDDIVLALMTALEKHFRTTPEFPTLLS
jgi:fatty acid amide hydrolase